MKKGQTWQGKIQNRTKDGRLYWEKETILPMIDHKGKISHFMALKEKMDAPAPSPIFDPNTGHTQSNRLKLAVHSSRIGIWELNLANNNLIWDDMMLELFGITRQQFKGTYQDWADRLHPEDLNRAEQEIHRLLAGKNSMDLTYRILWPDRSVRHLQAHGIIERGKDGSPLCLVGTSWDISRQKESETAIINAKNFAEQADHAKSAFLTTVGHEIRTPLNGIMGMTSLLSETELNEGQLEIVDTIGTSSDTLMSLLNDVLDYTAIEGGQIELETNSVNIVECVEEVIDILGPQAIEKGIQMAYQIDDSVPEIIDTDNTRLRQILINIVSNAVKFTTRGHVLLTVESRNRSKSTREIHFAIKDTGVGIPREKMPLLFKPFSQIDSSLSKAHEGAGLGLAISKRLAEALSGNIWVESIRDKGSTFHFTIKAGVEDNPVNISAEPMSNQLSGKHLLIVEGNDTSRRMLYQIAKAWGLQPSAVDNCAEALVRHHSNEPIDILLLADNMPDRSPDELHRIFRKTDKYRFLPIIRLGKLGLAPPDSLSACLGKTLKPAMLRKTMESLIALSNREKIKLQQIETLKAMQNGNKNPVLLIESHAEDRISILNQLNRMGIDAICADSAQSGFEAFTKQNVGRILLDMELKDQDSSELARIFLEGKPGIRQPWIIGIAAADSNDIMQKALQAGLHDFLTKPLFPGILADALKRGSASQTQMPSSSE